MTKEVKKSAKKSSTSKKTLAKESKATKKVEETKKVSENNKDVKKVETKVESKKTSNNKPIVMPKKSNAIVYILLVIGIIASVVAAQYFTTKNVDDIILAQLNYFEQGGVNYKVYYGKNPYYDKEADLSQPIMAQYVDKINASYNYHHIYSNSVDGLYKYQVVATLKVYDPADESNVYWSPTYKITEPKTVKFTNKSDYRVVESVNIDYSKYLNQYVDYKSRSSLATKAKLIVELKVLNDGEFKGLDSIKHESNILIDIPLSEAAFRISANTSIKPDEQTIKTVEDNQAERVYCMIIAGLCWVLAVFFAGVLLIVYRVNVAKESVYTRKLRKILNTYDSIIVNVEKLPKLSDLSVVNVTTFDELVDAQMEVRLPINFKEDEKNHVSKFVLVRNNLAWVYTLEEGNLSEK